MNATRLVSSVMPRFIALVACLLVSAQAAPQYGSDRGQWQILQARYGTASRNIDVTQTLREKGVLGDAPSGNEAPDTYRMPDSWAERSAGKAMPMARLRNSTTP